MISFEDFKKIDLIVAKVIKAEKVLDSEKLLRLELDLGENELRQMVAGIAKSYSPKDLMGKEIVIVANLEPRTILGLKSEAMLLAASNDDKIVILIPDKEVGAGSKIS